MQHVITASRVVQLGPAHLLSSWPGCPAKGSELTGTSTEQVEVHTNCTAFEHLTGLLSSHVKHIGSPVWMFGSVVPSADPSWSVTQMAMLALSSPSVSKSTQESAVFMPVCPVSSKFHWTKKPPVHAGPTQSLFKSF